MELKKRTDLPVQNLKGRVIQNAVGWNYPIDSRKMTICFAHYSEESGAMEPHQHAEETVVVLDGKDCYVRYGTGKENLENCVSLNPGDVMHFDELEWHVFGYEKNGYLDALCIYGQVDNIRPEEILKAREEQ